MEAPDLTLHIDDDRDVTLAELRGKPVVLYFYPKDDTPGCTTQACGIRDAWDDFRARGIEVFGVSIDDAESHRAFKEKLSLPFPLVVDREHELGDAFGVETISDEKPFYKRTTVLIDRDGSVKDVLQGVDPQTHAADVLAALSS